MKLTTLFDYIKKTLLRNPDFWGSITIVFQDGEIKFMETKETQK